MARLSYWLFKFADKAYELGMLERERSQTYQVYIILNYLTKCYKESIYNL